MLNKFLQAYYCHFVVIVSLWSDFFKGSSADDERHSYVQFECNFLQDCRIALVFVLDVNVVEVGIFPGESFDNLGNFHTNIKRLGPFVGKQDLKSSGGIEFDRLPDVLIGKELVEVGDGGLVELILGDEFEEERHEVVEIALDVEAVGSGIGLDDFADVDEVGALFCVEEGVRIVLDDVAELSLLFVLVLAALFQLLQFFYIEVVGGSGHLPAEVDPPAWQFGALELAVAYEFELLLHDGCRGCEEFVLFDHVLFTGDVGAGGGDDELLVVEFSEGEFEVIGGEVIPPIFVHELDGGLEELASFEFEEGLEQWIVLFFKMMFDSLALNYMMYEIGVGK